MPITRKTVKHGLRAAIEEIDKDGATSWFVRCTAFELNSHFTDLRKAEAFWLDAENGTARPLPVTQLS